MTLCRIAGNPWVVSTKKSWGIVVESLVEIVPNRARVVQPLDLPPHHQICDRPKVLGLLYFWYYWWT